MAITDLLTPVTASASARPATDTLAAPGYTHGATSATLSAGTNWADGVIYFTIYTTTTIGSTVVKDPTTQTDWKATKSGTSLTNMTLTGGSATQDYTTGAIVELTPTSRYAYDLYQWGTAHANLDGTLKTAAIQTAIGASNTTAGWTAVGFVPLYASNNGNKEFTCTVSTNLTSTLSTGMKLKMDRSVAPPTNSMAFVAASSQYATKASPTGISFSSAFTCEAYIYLNSYGSMGIITRDTTGTAGFGLNTNSSGQLTIFYGSAAAYTVLTSYQSLPLKRWVHVGGVISSVASKTGNLYINGVAIPASLTSSSATTLTQSGNLQVGADSGASFFDGYISEARVWSVAQSQANIQANMAISMTGAETNLVALFQGNGNFNDKTSNANNLTATGGAIATQAANPYASTEFGLLTGISYNGGTGNTTLTIFTGTDYTIPNQTLANFQYSTQRAPYGFPNAKGKWRLETILMGHNSVAFVGGAWSVATGPIKHSVPTGDWELGFIGYIERDDSVSNSVTYAVAISTNLSAPSDQNLVAAMALSAGSTYLAGRVNCNTGVTMSAMTDYTLLNYVSGGTSVTGVYGGSPNKGTFKIYSECAFI